MSWNVTAQGASKEEAFAEFTAKSQGALDGRHMPYSVFGMVMSAIGGLPECENSTIHVETFGHFNASDYRGTSNMFIKVENKFA